MPDFPNTVAIPTSYGPSPVDFSPIGNSANDFAQGQKNKFDEQQRQRALQLQQPLTENDPRAMALELSKRDPGLAAKLLPYLQGQEPGHDTPLKIPGMDTGFTALKDAWDSAPAAVRRRFLAMMTDNRISQGQK